MAITTQMRTDVANLYIALFGRAPERDGLGYWVQQLDAGKTVAQVAQEMYNTEPARANYPTFLTNEEIISKFYTNVLGRTADADGLAYWTAKLNAGATKGSVIAEMITAVTAYTGTDAAALDSKALFTNKQTVALYYAVDLGGNDVAKAGVVLSNVTKDAASVETAKASATTTTAGSNLTLTAAADLIAGTAANETINALVGTVAATGALSDTAQNVDIVDGGAGTDSINIQTQGGGTLGMKLTNVETVNYTVFANQTFSMANTTGVTTLNNINSIANLTVSNAAKIMDLSVQSTSATTTSVGYAAAAVAGAADTQKIALNGAVENAVVDFDHAVGGIETIAITTSGAASKVKLDDVGAVQTLTVAGDQNLTLAFNATNANASGLKSVDTSTATGKVTLDLATNVAASDLTVKTGAADDKVTVDNFTKDDNIDLGAGTDTVVIKAADATTVASVKLANVETVQFSVNSDNDNAGEAYTYNLAGATAVTGVKVGASTAAAGTAQSLTLNGLAATATTLTLDGNGAAADDDINTVTWNLATSTGTADALTINVSNKDAAGNLVNSTKGVQLASAVTANGIESITVTTDQLHADTNATTQDGGLLMTLTADALQTLTLTSASLLDMNGSALAATVKKVDASAATGGVIIDMSLAEDATTVANGATGTVNVTTGAGKDTVEKILGKVLTTVNTGEGNDTISLSAADIVKKVTIDAGAGNDSVDLSGDTSAIEKNVTLGDGVDTLKIAADGTQTNIKVQDFVAGAGGDKIDLAANGAKVAGTGVTGYAELATGTAAATAGLIVYTGNDLTAATEAGIQTLFDGTHATNNLQLGAGNTTNDIFYFAASNGTDTFLFHVTLGGANVEFTAAEDTAVLVATLVGVSDASTLSVDNFTDFLA